MLPKLGPFIGGFGAAVSVIFSFFSTPEPAYVGQIRENFTKVFDDLDRIKREVHKLSHQADWLVHTNYLTAEEGKVKLMYKYITETARQLKFS